MEKLLPFLADEGLPSLQETESVILTDTVLQQYWNAMQETIGTFAETRSRWMDSFSPPHSSAPKRARGFRRISASAKGDYSEKLGLLC